jgi:replicative DNA helicase
MIKHINERKGNYVSFVQSKIMGLSTGFPTLDRMIYGLQSGYHIIAARPSVGKTSLALNIALAVAKNKKKVMFFSLEMNETSFIERMVCILAGISPFDLRSGTISEDDKESLNDIDNELGDLNMYVDYKSSHNPASIASQLEYLKVEKQFIPDVIFIDYIQYMKTNNLGHATTPANLAEISRELVTIEKDLNIPMVVLCQLNRGADEYSSKADQKIWKPKVPRLSDLKGSGALEEDTDTVLLLHRSDYYQERESPDYDHSEAPLSNASIIVAKNRQGPCGSFSLTWLPEIFKFVEIKGE